MYKLLIFSLLILLGGACQKLELPPVVDPGDPVFNAQLFFSNGDSLRLAAGEDRYFMKTYFDQDSYDVFSFSGQLEQLDCLDHCGPWLRITIRDQEPRASGFTEIEQALKAGQFYEYRTDSLDSTIDTIISYRVSFTPTIDLVGMQLPWFWDFGDTVSVGEMPELLRADSLPFEACLSVSAPALGCNTVQCQTVQFSGAGSCAVRIVENMVGSNMLEAEVTGGQAPFTYEWSTGDSLSQIIVNTPGTYCVTLTDAGGCTSNSCVLLPQAIQPLCSAGFEYETEQEIEIISIPGGDSLQLGRVSIEFRDENGQRFFSEGVNQPPTAFFLIENVEDYLGNPEGFPTKKLNIRLSVKLEDEEGNILEINEGELVFSVAYPG